MNLTIYHLNEEPVFYDDPMASVHGMRLIAYASAKSMDDLYVIQNNYQIVDLGRINELPPKLIEAYK
jgi:hypothetical protein